MRGRRRGLELRRIVCVAAGLSCALALGTSASARTPIRLRIGDLVDVHGSQIACQVVVSGALSPGKSSITCLKEDAKGLPVVGSYAVTLTAAGAVEAYVFTRKRQAKAVTVRQPKGIPSPYIVCFQADRAGRPKANAYSFLCSDTLSAVLRVGRDGSPHQVFEHRNP